MQTTALTPEQHIALEVLQTFAGPYYVAATDTQRRRALDGATAHIRPFLLAYANMKANPPPHEQPAIQSDQQPRP